MIPPNAKCVYKGPIFQVFQWNQEMYDGRTEVFEALKRPDTVEIIATVDGKVVVLEQLQPHQTEPYLCLPGGRVDEGESAIEAAVRELREETGYVSDEWELLHAWSPSGKIHWTISAFIAKNCRKVGEQELDGGEKINVRLVSFEEFLDLADNEQFRHVDLKVDLIRAKYDPRAQGRLRGALFGAQTE